MSILQIHILEQFICLLTKNETSYLFNDQKAIFLCLQTYKILFVRFCGATDAVQFNKRPQAKRARR